MSSETATPKVVPLAAAEEDSLKKLSTQIKRAADQHALDRNCQLIDSFIQEKWPQTANA